MNWYKQITGQWVQRFTTSLLVWNQKDSSAVTENIPGIFPIYRVNDERDRRNFQGLYLTSTSYVISSNLILTRLVRGSVVVKALCYKPESRGFEIG
jgi:hypothetical protein